MCIWLVSKPFFFSENASQKGKAESQATTPVSNEKSAVKRNCHVYSVDFIRSINPGAIPDTQYTYKIDSRPVESTQSYSPAPYRSRNRSPDPYNYFRNHTPEPEGFVNRSPRSRLDPEEERMYIQSMREKTPDYCPMAVEELPKDIQTGRVQYLRKNNGRIHVVQPINGIKDIFFHLRDCELDEGDSIQLGDSVMFELSLFENRICAVKVKKTTKIPSPDFSRRVMKHSKEMESQNQIEELTL